MRGVPCALCLAGLAGWLLSGPVAVVKAADGGEAAARQEWMLGYLEVEQAGTALQAEQFALARQLYTEALRHFGEVGRRFPDWNPELVRYRTAHCTEQLRRLDETAATAVDRMGRAELVAEVRRLRDLGQGADAQVQALTTKVGQLESALDSALLGRQKADAEAVRLAADLARGQAAVADLTARLEAVTRELRAREADLERLQADAGDAAGLKTRLTELARQAESAVQAQQEATAARTRIAELETGQRQAASRQAELAAEADRFRRENEAVRAERDREVRARREATDRTEQAEGALGAAAKELEDARRQLAEAGRESAAAAGRQAAAETQAAKAEESLAGAARDSAALRAEAAALRDELKALQAEDVARLRERHAAALGRIEELAAAAERDSAALKAAREAVQRLTAEHEAVQRAAREAAEAERQRRTEIGQAEAAAAQALATGEPATAEASLRRLLEVRPGDARAAARLGILLADRGDLVAALPLLEEARRALPDDPDTLLPLGAARLRQGQALPALAALLQATLVAPDRADVRHLAGVALAEAGCREAAEREFARAFELDGRRADTAYCLAALLASGAPPRRREAREWYERALGLGAARDAGLDQFFAQDR
jgi:Flp pilus assembly protein TadD